MLRQPLSRIATGLVALQSIFLFSRPILPGEPGSEKDTRNVKPAKIAVETITASESQFHVDMLASDEFQGRGSGSAGQWLAAKYIANEFSQYGLSPVGDDGRFYQNFQLTRTDLETASLEASIKQLDTVRRVSFSAKTDFIPFSFTGERDVEASVVFAGYGITAPEYGYDDYEGIDANGKIVLVLRHEPQEHESKSIWKGNDLTLHSLFEKKAKNAYEHGAAGLLIVTDPASGHDILEPQGYWPSLSRGRAPRKRWRLDRGLRFASLPAAWISVAAAEKLLESSRSNLVQLQSSIDESGRPESFTLPGVAIRLSIDLKMERRKTQNVVGLLEGSDLKDEFIVVGAHYDHLGTIDGKIFYGADDNASGTAGILEIAETFCQMPARPRRSVLFIAFAAEEMGLLGSKYYVEHPVKPLDQTTFMLNLDMISRNGENEVTVVGSNRSPEVHAINLAANKEIGLHINYNGEKYFHRSDHANFAEHEIPVLFYNTEVHRDYHRPTDSAAKINAAKIAKISRLGFLVAWEIANADERPSFRRLN